MGEIRIWDLTSATSEILQSAGSAGVERLAFSPDGIRLVVGPFDANSHLVVWNIDARRETGRFEASEIECVKFNPSGSLFACCGEHVTLHDGITGEPRKVLGAHRDWTLSAAWSADGQWLATGAAWEDSTICVWNTASGTLEKTMDKLPDYAYAFENIVFKSADTLVFTDQYCGPFIWHWPSEKRARPVWSKRHCYPSALSPNGNYLAEVIDETPDIIRPQHDMPDMSPDFRNNIDYCTLQITNLESGNGEYWHGRARLYEDVTAIEYSPDGQHVATADRDGALYVWSVKPMPG